MARFLKHPTHCAHFIGGEEFGDGVSPDYSRRLTAVLGKPRGQDLETFSRIETACAAELSARAGVKLVATKGPAKQAK